MWAWRGIWARLYIETDVQLRVFILPGRERRVMTSPGASLLIVRPDHFVRISFIHLQIYIYHSNSIPATMNVMFIE